MASSPAAMRKLQQLKKQRETTQAAISGATDGSEKQGAPSSASAARPAAVALTHPTHPRAHRRGSATVRTNSHKHAKADEATSRRVDESAKSRRPHSSSAPSTGGRRSERTTVTGGERRPTRMRTPDDDDDDSDDDDGDAGARQRSRKQIEKEKEEAKAKARRKQPWVYLDFAIVHVNQQQQKQRVDEKDAKGTDGASSTSTPAATSAPRLVGRVMIELFSTTVPKTAENFRALCCGDHKGIVPDSPLFEKPLHFKDSKLHRVQRGFGVQGGDIISGDGEGGESIYGSTFPDESFINRRVRPGSVLMANSGPDTNTSQFFILTSKDPDQNWLAQSRVVFGQVRSGMQVLRQIELAAGSESGQIKRGVEVRIIKCGRVKKEERKKFEQEKAEAHEKSGTSENDAEARVVHCPECDHASLYNRRVTRKDGSSKLRYRCKNEQCRHAFYIEDSGPRMKQSREDGDAQVSDDEESEGESDDEGEDGQAMDESDDNDGEAMLHQSKTSQRTKKQPNQKGSSPSPSSSSSTNGHAAPAGKKRKQPTSATHAAPSPAGSSNSPAKKRKSSASASPSSSLPSESSSSSPSSSSQLPSPSQLLSTPSSTPSSASKKLNKRQRQRLHLAKKAASKGDNADGADAGESNGKEGKQANKVDSSSSKKKNKKQKLQQKGKKRKHADDAMEGEGERAIGSDASQNGSNKKKDKKQKKSKQNQPPANANEQPKSGESQRVSSSSPSNKTQRQHQHRQLPRQHQQQQQQQPPQRMLTASNPPQTNKPNAAPRQAGNEGMEKSKKKKKNKNKNKLS